MKFTFTIQTLWLDAALKKINHKETNPNFIVGIGTNLRKVNGVPIIILYRAC